MWIFNKIVIGTAQFGMPYGVANQNGQVCQDEMHEVGYNYRITDFQCALGNNQLKKLDKFVERRRKIAIKYNEALSDENRMIIPSVMKNTDHAFHIYPLQIKIDEINIDKCYIFEKF